MMHGGRRSKLPPQAMLRPVGFIASSACSVCSTADTVQRWIQGAGIKIGLRCPLRGLQRWVCCQLCCPPVWCEACDKGPGTSRRDVGGDCTNMRQSGRFGRLPGLRLLCVRMAALTPDVYGLPWLMRQGVENRLGCAQGRRTLVVLGPQVFLRQMGTIVHGVSFTVVKKNVAGNHALLATICQAVQHLHENSAVCVQLKRSVVAQHVGDNIWCS